jgi:hypothetical protein
MFSGDWTPPCGSCCTKKYASLVQIPCQCLGPSSPAKLIVLFFFLETNGIIFPPILQLGLGVIGRWLAGRVFCKKGCNADGDTWEECEYACYGVQCLSLVVVIPWFSVALEAKLFWFQTLLVRVPFNC